MKRLAGCVIAFAPSVGHVLLGKHKTRGWMIAGGKNEGEEIIETAYREFKEETGMPLTHGVLDFLFYHEHDDWLAMVFLVVVNCEPKYLLAPKFEEQFEEWKWFPLNNLPDGMYFASQDVLRKFKDDLGRADSHASRLVQAGPLGQLGEHLPERRMRRILRPS